MSSMAFFAADMLGMTLYQVDGGLKSSEIHQIKWGPWNVEVLVEAKSDIICGREITFWVTMAKKLRLYVVVRDKECWLMMLDSERMKKCDKKGYVGETLNSRFLEILPAVSEFYSWRNDKWTQTPLDKVKV